MRNLIRLFSLVCLSMLATTAQAEPGFLWVKVLNLKDRPINRIRVGAEDPGSSDITDDRGLARIRIAPQTGTKNWVTLNLSDGNYEFVSPWDRKIPIPDSRNGLENPLTLYLTDKGNREALKSIKFIVASAAKCNAMLAASINDKRTAEEERKSALAAVARSFGLTAEDVDHAIRELGKKAVDPYDKGVIALYEQNYQEATTQLSRSYDLRKAAFDKALAEMVDVAFSLGQALRIQGRYHEAVEKLREANALRNDDVSVINYLGVVLFHAGHYAEAETYLNRALAIQEKSLESDRLDAAISLNQLAALLDTATIINNLADLYSSQGKYAEAESLYKRAIAIWEKALDADHPMISIGLNNLAELYKAQGKYVEAEPLYNRALAIRKKALGADHPSTATSLNNLASLYSAQGKYAEAEPLFKQALAIAEKRLSAEHPNTATMLGNYAALLRKMNREDEAVKLETRAKEIRAKAGNK